MLHAAVADEIARRPEILERAKRRVASWLRHGRVARPYAEAWWEILAQPTDEIRYRLVDPSEPMRDLRQCSPFAGALDPRTRWRILAETRAKGTGE